MRRLGSLLLAFLLAGAAAAQSFSLQDVLQEVFIGSDGTVRVEDTRSLVLNGDFSDRVEKGNTYFINVEPNQGGSVTFESLEALDGGLPVQAKISGNEIAWKVRGANETRTFRFSYTLTDEFEVATDVARLRREFLEVPHEPIRNYTQIIHPPAPSPEQFKVFVFTGSGRIGTLDFAPDFSEAMVKLDELATDEQLGTVLLLDASLFNFQTINRPMEQQWLNELSDQTSGFRRESAQILRDAGRGPPPAPPSPVWAGLVWAGVVAAGLWVFRSYQRHGREPDIPEVGPYYREPAEDIPPAAVPFVLSQSDPGLKAASPAIAATLLDFARRGYLTLESTTTSGFLGLGSSETVRYHLAKQPDNLTPFEADLWKAFKGAARQGTFAAEDLKRYFEKRPSFGQKWVAKPRAWYESTHGSLLDSASNVAVFTVPPVCFVLAAGAGFGAFSVNDTSGLLTLSLFAGAVLLAIFGVVAAVSLRRWDADKLLNAKRWEAYRKFLSDFSLMRESPAEHYKLWDYHFVYATALGVSKQYLKNLQKLMSAEPDKFVTPVWLYGYGSPGGLGRIPTPGDLETLSRSLNTLSQIETNLGNLNSALSPQTKTGGGFSGGGFGGGGFSGGGSSGGGGGSGMR